MTTGNVTIVVGGEFPLYKRGVCVCVLFFGVFFGVCVCVCVCVCVRERERDIILLNACAQICNYY